MELMAQTVLGTVPGAQLGFTLPHEHLVFDGTSIFAPPAAASDRGMAYEPVGWATLSWLRYHPYENLDNVRMLDEGEAAQELALFRQAGGSTLVDVTVPGIGRDPAALVRLAHATGVQIVMGTGFYTEPSLEGPYRDMSVDVMAGALIRDVKVGVGTTGVRAGIIGEIACNWPAAGTELRAVRAAALAQQETSAAISLHPGRNREAPFQLVGLLREAGADLTRVIFCHIDARLRDSDDRLRLADEGCVLEYDLWGWEGHFPSYWTSDDYMDLPNDTDRIGEVRELAERGHAGQVFISHDICVRSRRVRWGGWGYRHIPAYVVPMMRLRGVSEDLIRQFTVENPRRLLCFVRDGE
ncbi:MAG: aryldialkylphosphatase [Dehalococcoidia bacterium]|jgi:phosphotriesterase-related protein|nr:aryldialkylphosphatase [Dehalococcoidia bacterium]